MDRKCTPRDTKEKKNRNDVFKALKPWQSKIKTHGKIHERKSAIAYCPWTLKKFCRLSSETVQSRGFNLNDVVEWLGSDEPNGFHIQSDIRLQSSAFSKLYHLFNSPIQFGWNVPHNRSQVSLSPDKNRTEVTVSADSKENLSAIVLIWSLEDSKCNQIELHLTPNQLKGKS